MTTQIGHMEKKDTLHYIQIINDVFAILYVVVVFCMKDTISSSEPIALFLFMMPTILRSYLEGRSIRLIVLWATAFYGYCLISILWTIAPSTYFTALIKMLLMFITTSLYMTSMREVDVILKGFIVGGIILSLRLLIETPYEQLITHRLGSSIGINENIVGLLFSYASSICLYYIKKTKAYLVLYLLFTLMALLSGSRKAFALILIVVFCYYINSIKKISNVLYIIPFGILFFLVIELTMNNPILYNIIGRRVMGLLNMFTGEGKVDTSTLARMDLIQIGIELFKEKMWVGYGFNSFIHLNKYKLIAHNNYIELLVCHGIIGTVLYYLMPISILIQLIRIWLAKTREVVIAILFIDMILVGDYGTVSYHVSTSLVLMCVSYSFVVFYGDNSNKKIR